VVWLNVGRREKRLIFLIQERDDPVGQPILIWDAACREFKIEYKSYMSKRKQRAMFYEEKYVKRAFMRLFKQKITRLVWPLVDGFSFVPPYRGCGVDFMFCVLTEKGRRVAEQLRLQDRILREQLESVVKVLERFRGLGCVAVTVLQVREGLWVDLCGEFGGSRVEFDKCWNNTRIGLLLRECTLRNSRFGVNDRWRKYYLV